RPGHERKRGISIVTLPCPLWDFFPPLRGECLIRCCEGATGRGPSPSRSIRWKLRSVRLVRPTLPIAAALYTPPFLTSPIGRGFRPLPLRRPPKSFRWRSSPPPGVFMGWWQKRPETLSAAISSVYARLLPLSAPLRLTRPRKTAASAE